MTTAYLHPFTSNTYLSKTLSKKFDYKDLYSLHGPGFISGNSYEFDDTQPLSNVKYRLIHQKTNKIVDEYFSNNGHFYFEDLKLNEEFSVVATDTSEKYIGKLLENVTPALNPQEYMKIITVFKVPSKHYYKVKYSGIGVLNISGNAVLTKLDDYNYHVTEINSDYSLSLADYYNNDVYLLNMNIKI